jgi:hypothetical protein
MPNNLNQKCLLTKKISGKLFMVNYIDPCNWINYIDGPPTRYLQIIFRHLFVIFLYIYIYILHTFLPLMAI